MNQSQFIQEMRDMFARENADRLKAYQECPSLARLLLEFFNVVKAEADAQGWQFGDVYVKDLRLTPEGRVFFGVDMDVEKVGRRAGILLPDMGPDPQATDRALREGGQPNGA